MLRGGEFGQYKQTRRLCCNTVCRHAEVLPALQLYGIGSATTCVRWHGYSKEGAMGHVLPPWPRTRHVAYGRRVSYLLAVQTPWKFIDCCIRCCYGSGLGMPVSLRPVASISCWDAIILEG